MTKVQNWLKYHSIAHRGFQNRKSGIIENTIEAALLAKEKGYPIEIDIKMTDSGDIILFHDRKATRLLGINKLITSFTKEEIDNSIYLNTKCKIAYFKDLLKRINGDIPLLIEIKYWGDKKRIKKTIEKVAKTLKNYKGKYAIQSFYPKIKEEYLKYNPNIPVGIIAPFFGYKGIMWKIVNNLSLPFLIKNDCDFITLGPKYTSNKNIKKVIAKNKPLLFWYITNKKAEEFAKKHSANLIFADYEDTGYIAPK